MPRYRHTRKWDPSWGWGNEVYHLGAFPISNEKKFFLSPSYLMKGNKVVLSSSKDYRLCAGNFNDQFYFGSLTYTGNQKGFCLDQSVVVYNKEFELLNELRPSDIIKNPSKNFTCKRDFKNDFIFGFRDPAIMPNGNLAVCTGGFRWETFGNICELSYKNNELKILRESILDEKLKSFPEIERCTFWNEYMFFSVRGPMEIIEKPNEIQVAKLNRNGFYSYYGSVDNSLGLYGCNLNQNLQLLFWYPQTFSINNPSKQNLFFENSKWILKEEKIIKHFIYRVIPIVKNKKNSYKSIFKILILNLRKFIVKLIKLL